MQAARCTKFRIYDYPCTLPWWQNTNCFYRR